MRQRTLRRAKFGRRDDGLSLLAVQNGGRQRAPTGGGGDEICVVSALANKPLSATAKELCFSIVRSLIRGTNRQSDTTVAAGVPLLKRRNEQTSKNPSCRGAREIVTSFGSDKRWNMRTFGDHVL